MATCIVRGTGGSGKGLIIDAPIETINPGFPVKKGQVLYSNSRNPIFSKLATPNELPANNVYKCTFSSDGNYLAVGLSTSSYARIYKRDGDTFTKLVDLVIPTGTVWGCAFSTDGNYLSITHDSSPFITIYKRNGDVFTKLPNPTNLPTGVINHCAFSPYGNYLAIAHANSPFITVYKRSDDVFTKLPNPEMLPSGTGVGCTFSPCENYLAVGHFASPFITVFKIIKSFSSFLISGVTDVYLAIEKGDGNSIVKANHIEL